MAPDISSDVYDLLILVDATSSMTTYLESLKTSLPKVIAISNLTDSFARVGLLAYRDYSEADHDTNGLLEWSGWYDPKEPNAIGNVSAASLIAAASRLEADGGGDFPEATKTGLARAYSLMREEATTIILLYTDAPPHCEMVAYKDEGGNYHAEQAALNVPKAYGGYGPYFADWVSACKQLHAGPKKAHVFSFLDEYLGTGTVNSGYYTYLSTITRGACISLSEVTSHSIAQITVDVLLAWMSVEKAGAEKVAMPATLVRYKNGDNLKRIKNEKDANANPYFWAYSSVDPASHPMKAAEDIRTKGALTGNVAEVKIDSHVLKRYLPKRRTPVADFAQRYAKDDQYKVVVVEQLKAMIESDVTSLSLNPIFGALWRAVCNDRENPVRDELITAFSLHVERINNADEKSRMKNWLEESYDHAAEILETLESVPHDQRFPCVFLDPTIEFCQAQRKGDDDADEDNRPITALRRDELLEIGRSCDGRILRRLGRVLTRLTYVHSASDMPSHITATTSAELAKIPLVLASKEHGWAFFKVLLHAVLPGTKLSTRPATVLAALAIRIGLKPLFESACAAMLFWRDKWNNLDVPETWNSGCMGLLLDADEEYRKQTAGHHDGGDDNLLLRGDRRLFSQLVTYQYTGANLLTTLTAKVRWTPDKTSMPLGPVMICRSCKFPRSVTIMVSKSGGRCGLCVAEDWTDENHKKRAIRANVAHEDTEASSATWTECSVRTCRAQYVCYNPTDLNVRPKCHYCRSQNKLPPGKRSNNPVPTLECMKCLSKVVWPNEYRASAGQPFICIACGDHRTTIIAVETNADQLSKENGQSWLLHNDGNTIKEPFKRSLFHTITNVGVDRFLANVDILPDIQPEPTLTLKGKRLRNQADLKAELRSWIQRRTSEKSPCSLCFRDLRNADLLPACRRHGCHQQICGNCLGDWYGLNSAGTIINIAALFCPFCRRSPAACTLAAYGKGIHAVGDLLKAVEERGQWIHAWCYDCGKARRYMERECARGAPDPVDQWKCESCIESDLERARVAEEEARQAVALAARLDAEERVAAYVRLQNAERLRKQLEFPVKECPGCKTPTQKTAGCDHMTCSVRFCGTNWCWACGDKLDGNEVYEHMHKVHRSMFAGGLGLEELG
ncbi:hypothetical protein CC86DRAFT_462261 [Ophiobolus disseminans]|uniref:RBR-type E3 ubiquitin transferase n=1 Tax=Ophiobolus disseminans TaxID=1469910 RepID=A0A6A7AGN9_9PLEO|nr:hypothetical protein CC86DRAFT_462261 [Ophiobolus disseminans]